MSYQLQEDRVLAGSLNLLPPGDLLPEADALALESWRVDRQGALRSRLDSSTIATLSGNLPATGTIYKLQPHRTLHMQGSDGFGSAAALWGASDTGFDASGVLRDQADQAVLVLFKRDDYFGHPRFQYLPDGVFTGMKLQFDIDWTGIQAFESKKSAWTSWNTLNVVKTDGTTDTKLLKDIATVITTGRVGASRAFTIVTDSAIEAFDRVTLWYQNIAFDYIAGAGAPGTFTPTDVATDLASQINATDWTANGPVVLSATAVGAVLTITAEAGADGNMVQFYQLNKNTRLYATAAAGNWRLSGGSSDVVAWHITVDFDSLGWTSIEKLYLTFAAALANSAAYASTEFAIHVRGWTVSDPSVHRQLKVAGPVSSRIEDTAGVFVGTWSAAPAGFYSQGTAKRSLTVSDTATFAGGAVVTSDIYVGTRLDADCGIMSVTLDGGAPVTLDCYATAANARQVRRRLFTGVAGGNHTVVITVTHTKNGSSSNYYQYVDFVEFAVASDIPAPITLRKVGPATDYDTEHGRQLSPQRLQWTLAQLGYQGEIDHYAGVGYWNQRQRSGGTFPAAVVTFAGTWADGESAFLTIGGSTIGKSVFPTDTSTTIAKHFANYINAIFVGVRASSSAGVLTVTTRSTGAIWLFTFSKSTTSALGTINFTGDLSTGAAEGDWVINAAATPVLNRAAHDWHLDFFRTLHDADRPNTVVVSFSQELINPPDGADIWIQRFPDASPASTATGIGSLYSSQCCFSTHVRDYMKKAHAEMAALMVGGGIAPKTQFGEVGWWFAASGGGMAYYDADTAAAAVVALGRALYTFTGPTNDPATNGYSDADFLRGRLRDYVAFVQAYVLTQVPTWLCEVLYPLDVNDPTAKRLNYYVNLPLEWKIRPGSGFDTLMMEGFQYAGIDHNVPAALVCAAYGFTTLGWPIAYCRYLEGVFYGDWPWPAEYAGASALGLPFLKIWAADHACLFGWALGGSPTATNPGYIHTLWRWQAHRYAGGDEALYRDGAAIASGFDGRRIGLAAMNGYSWAMNQAKQLRDNGSSVKDWAAIAPGAAPVIADVAGGTLVDTKTYTYWVTWVTEDGEETNPSPSAAWTIAAPNQLLGIDHPANADPHVTHWNVYRIGNTLASAYRVNADLIPIAQATFTDDGYAPNGRDDVGLTRLGILMQTDNDPQPAAAGLTGPYFDRMLAWRTAEHSNWLFWSKTLAPYAWPGSALDEGNHIPVGEDGEDLLTVVGHSRHTRLYKSRSIWRQAGDPGSTDAVLEIMSPDIGLIGEAAIATQGDIDYFQGAEGIYACNGYGTRKVSAKLDPLFKNDPIPPYGLPASALNADFAVRAKNTLAIVNGRLYFSYAAVGETTPQHSLVYDIEGDRWYSDDRGFSALFYEGQGYNLVGAHASAVLQLEAPQTSAIALYYRSGHRDQSKPDHQKTYADLVVEHSVTAANPAVTLNATLITDYGTATQTPGTLPVGQVGATAHRTRTVIALGTGGLGVQARNLSVGVEGIVGFPVEIYNIAVHYRLLPRDALTFDSFIVDLGAQGDKYIDLIQPEIDSSATVTWKIYTDLPSNAMTQRATGTFSATGAQKAVDIPFTRVEGRYARVTLTSPGTFRLFRLRLRVQSAGLYLNGAAGDTWHSQEIGFGSLDRVNLFSRIAVDAYVASDAALTFQSDLPSVLTTHRTVNLGTAAARSPILVKLPGSAKGRYGKLTIAPTADMRLNGVQVWGRSLTGATESSWNWSPGPAPATGENYVWVEVPTE